MDLVIQPTQAVPSNEDQPVVSTVPTQRMVGDLDIELIAVKVVQYMREPASRWRCQCGECANCRAREGMRKSRGRGKKAEALLRLHEVVDPVGKPRQRRTKR